MKSINFFLIVSSFYSIVSLASPVAKYEEPVPDHVCAVAEQIKLPNFTCEDNKIYLQKANECLVNVQAMEAQVQKDLSVRLNDAIAANTQAQKTNFNTDVFKSSEALKAHKYIHAVAEKALDELDDFFDYVVIPEHDESTEDIMGNACYRDAVIPMDQIAEKLEDKISAIEDAMEKETGHKAVSSTSEAKLNQGALIKGKMVQKPKSPAKSAKGINVEDSTITNTTRNAPKQPEKAPAKTP